MSRTDVHTPYWVKLRDQAWRSNFTESHDHSTGVCDLEQFLASREWIRTNCRVDLALVDGNVHCGCRLCTGQAGRKQARRRERAELRVQLRTAATTTPEDRDTIDIPRPGPAREW